LHPRFDRENCRLPDQQDVDVVFEKLAPGNAGAGRFP
jgi:hypothetical protein